MSERRQLQRRPAAPMPAREPEAPPPDEVQLNVRIDRETADAFRDACKSYGRTQGGLFADAFNQWLRRQKPRGKR